MLEERTSPLGRTKERRMTSPIFLYLYLYKYELFCGNKLKWRENERGVRRKERKWRGEKKRPWVCETSKGCGLASGSKQGTNNRSLSSG